MEKKVSVMNVLTLLLLLSLTMMTAGARRTRVRDGRLDEQDADPLAGGADDHRELGQGLGGGKEWHLCSFAQCCGERAGYFLHGI